MSTWLQTFPTLAMISAVSRRSWQRPVFAFARKSSINRIPMLYPLKSIPYYETHILSSCLLTWLESSVSLHSWATTEPYVKTNSSAFWILAWFTRETTTFSTRFFHKSSPIFAFDMGGSSKPLQASLLVPLAGCYRNLSGLLVLT